MRRSEPNKIVRRAQSTSTNIAQYAQQLAINLVVSLIIPIVANLVATITPINQVFLGAFVFSIGLLVQILRELQTSRQERAPALELWQVQNDADILMNNIRASYSRIATRRNWLYARYFQQKLKQLEMNMIDAASSEDLAVEQDSDTTDIMLRDFSGHPDDVVRFICYFTDVEFIFSVHASHFFCDVADRVARGEIVAVRRLFIMDDETQLQDAKVRKLISFHERTAGFDHRIMQKRDFERIKRDFHLPTDTKDFGVYSNWYVYRSVVAADHDVRGTFSANSEMVKKFSNAFDRCWNSELSFKLVDGLSDTMTLKELFGRDPISPNRPGITQVSPKLPPSSGSG